MQVLTGVPKHHDWGSFDAIPRFLGVEPGSDPVAELWFGAHPLGASGLPDGSDLKTLIESDPESTLGPSTQFTFGDELPYLVKLIAPRGALSIQVHPGRRRAARGYEEEEAAGVKFDAFERIFHDQTHKPEMVYAISEFDALIGFAVRRQARERLENLGGKTASRLSRKLLLATGRGIKPVVSWILDPKDGPDAADVLDFVSACERRVKLGESPDLFIDQATVKLLAQFGPDPAILIAFLMNHVHLDPGETAFLQTGTVHSYQQGIGLELMANSDNVVRAGLTSKHVDTELFLEIADFDGVPPTRIAPEHPIPGINHFRSPVEDFELVTAEPKAPGARSPLPLPGSGPRVMVCLKNSVRVTTMKGSVELHQGDAVFLLDTDGRAVAEGDGTVAVCGVP